MMRMWWHGRAIVALVAIVLLLVPGVLFGTATAQEKKTLTVVVLIPNGGDPY